MTETAIRLADLKDVPALIELMGEYYAHDQLDFEADLARSALSELLSCETLGRIWLICQGSVPIGYVVLTFGYSLEFGGRDAFIDELYIQEFYRGRGIGTRVLRLVQSAARSMGINAFHLEVERDNRRAQQFYRSLGFEDRHRFRLMSKRF